MKHIYDSCILLGEKLDKQNKRIEFDIFKGGRFLSIQPGKSMEEYDNQFIATKIAQAVTNETKLYKNVIQPFVREIIDEINNNANKNALKLNKAAEYGITILDYPEITNDILKHKFFDFDPSKEYSFIKLPDMNFTPIYKNEVSIKDGSFNRMAKEIFTPLDLTEEKINHYYTFINSDPTLAHYSEITNLVKSFLYFTMISGEYPDYFQHLKRIGCAIYFLKNKMDAEIEAGALIADVVDKEIFLYGKVYETVPNKGDLTEAIFGASLENDINSSLLKSSLQNIITNKDLYEKRWEQFNIASSYEDPINKQSQMRSIIVITIEKYLNELDEDVFRFTNYEKKDLGYITYNIDQFLVKEHINLEFDALTKLIYKLMSEFIFVKTNYGQFVEIVNEILTKSNRLEMNDIITLVNAKFIVRYLMNKTKIVEL